MKQGSISWLPQHSSRYSEGENLKRRVYKNAIEGVTPSIQRLDTACRFFWEVGLPAIEREFPSHVDRIAAGCIAAGSDCGAGASFQVYLTQRGYDEIGAPLQSLLISLSNDCEDACRDMTGEQYGSVFSIDAFYRGITSNGYGGGFESAPNNSEDWLRIPEHRLFDLANGQVFYDPLCEFTERRRGFMSYYPEDAWRFKLCRALLGFGEYGQVVLPSALADRDYFTAEVAWWRFACAAMRLGFHLVREYSPDEKRLYKAFSQLAEFAPSVVNLIWNGQCDIEHRPAIVEEVASIYRKPIVDTGLLDCGLVEGSRSFAELARGMAEGISSSVIRAAALRAEGVII